VDLATIRQSLVAGDVPKAVEQFEARKEKKTDLLYLLEKGYMLHLAGRWAESNTAFEAAEQRADELFTKSISRQAAAFLTSDLALPYRGMPYELQLVQYYRALNYLELGQVDDALVEARKANFLLTKYAEEKSDHTGPRQDAFMQYFTGLLYEATKEVNDAIVSFRDAARLYRIYGDTYGIHAPSWLDEDYFAAAEYLGLHNEADSLAAADPDLPQRAAAHDANNLVIFVELGFVPYREPVDITLPIFEFKDDDKDKDDTKKARHYVHEYGHDVYAYRADRVKLDHVLRFSFPQLVEYPTDAVACEIVLPQTTAVDAQPALNLDAVARSEFNDRIPGILLKTVARALAKEQARKTAKKQDEALGWLVNAFNVATEQSDTRGWIFLPGRILMLKAALPTGESNLTVRILDTESRVVEEWEITVRIAAGETRFIALRSFR